MHYPRKKKKKKLKEYWEIYSWASKSWMATSRHSFSKSFEKHCTKVCLCCLLLGFCAFYEKKKKEIKKVRKGCI